MTHPSTASTFGLDDGAAPEWDGYIEPLLEGAETPEPLWKDEPMPSVPEDEQRRLARKMVTELNVNVDLADYLAAVERFARRYVAFPSEHEPVAVALWVAHARRCGPLGSPCVAGRAARNEPDPGRHVGRDEIRKDATARRARAARAQPGAVGPAL